MGDAAVPAEQLNSFAAKFEENIEVGEGSKENASEHSFASADFSPKNEFANDTSEGCLGDGVH